MLGEYWRKCVHLVVNFVFLLSLLVLEQHPYPKGLRGTTESLHPEQNMVRWCNRQNVLRKV